MSRAKREPRNHDYECGGIHFSIAIERLDSKYTFDWTCPRCGSPNDHPSIYDNPDDAIRWAEIGIRTHVDQKHPQS